MAIKQTSCLLAANRRVGYEAWCSALGFDFMHWVVARWCFLVLDHSFSRWLGYRIPPRCTQVTGSANRIPLVGSSMCFGSWSKDFDSVSDSFYLGFENP